MRMHDHSARFVPACLLLIFGFAWAAPAQADITYSGRAFTAFVNVPTLSVGPQFISDTGELPPSGGFKSTDFAAVGVPGVLNANLLVASTSGANSVARSAASLAEVVVLPGNAAQVTASFVRAESEATCNGVRGATEITNLTFGGQAIAVDPFAPNQTFVIPNPMGARPWQHSSSTSRRHRPGRGRRTSRSTPCTLLSLPGTK